MEDSGSAVSGGPGTGGSGSQKRETGWSRYNRNRRRLYLGVLLFVVVCGTPIAAIPALRTRLKSRIDTLRAAYRGEPAIQPPASARVGESSGPFPKEYERPRAQAFLLPQMVTPRQRQPYRIILGGGEMTMPDSTEPPSRSGQRAGATSPGAALTPGGGKPILKNAPGTAAPAVAPVSAPAETSSEPQYRKGKNEQEAYDLLINANQVLAGMVQGGDATLKFQDWSAASMGENSFYVMLTFVQAADNAVRKYIWNVKVATKEVIPLSAYAMSISK